MAFLKKDPKTDRMILTQDPHRDWSPFLNEANVAGGKQTADPYDKSNYFIPKGKPNGK